MRGVNPESRAIWQKSPQKTIVLQANAKSLKFEFLTNSPNR